MKRRYKQGQHETYDIALQRAVRASQILTPNNNPFNLNSEFMDRRGLEALALNIGGNESGVYFLPGKEPLKALIPNVLDELKLVEKKFSRANQQTVNEGRPPLEKMPQHLEERKFQLEARLDVLIEELRLIKERLKTFTDEEQKLSDAQVLKRGPQGSGQLQSGIIISWDGQDVAANTEGVLVISDKRSPYHGLSSIDYYSKVVKPWLRASLKLKNAKRKILAEHNWNEKSKDFKLAWSKRREVIFKQNPDYKNLFVKMLPGKPLMPKWPAGVTNYKKNEEK